MRFKRTTFLLACLLLIPIFSSAQNSLVDRVGNTGFVRVEARSFQSLDLKQQQLAYWLSQASIAIDPIIYDQFSRFGLRQKRLLEGIVAHSASGQNDKIIAFAKLFCAVASL